MPVLPPADRAREAIAAFRSTQDHAALDVLRMDGARHIAHALTMEHVYRNSPADAAEHTAVISEFLGE